MYEKEHHINDENHSSDYKKEALILAKQIEVKRASVQLGLHEP